MTPTTYTATQLADAYKRGYSQGYQAGYREGAMTPQERESRAEKMQSLVYKRLADAPIPIEALQA